MGTELEKQIKKSEGILQGLQKKREQAQKALTDAQKKFDALVTEQDPLEDQLESVRSQMNKAKKEVEEYGKLWRQGIIGADKSQEDARKKVESLESEYEEIWKQVSKMATGIEKANSEVVKQAESVAGIDVEIENANRLLEQQKAEAQEAAEALGNSREELKNISENAEIASQHIIDLSHQLEELEKRQKKLEAAGLGLGYKEYDENKGKIDNITAELKKYQATLKETQSGTAAEPFGNISDSAGKLVSTLQKIAPALSKGIGSASNEVISALSKIPGKVGVIATAVKVSLEVIGAIGKKVAEQIRKEFERMKMAVQVSWKAISTMARTTVAAVTKAFSGAAKSLSVLGKGLSTVGKGVLDAAKNMNVFSRMSNALEGVFKRLGNTIKSALVFSVIYKGLSMVKSEMASYLTVNQQFVAALNQIKGVLLTAFQPIYDVVVPALTTLLNFLSSAIAVVSHFTAALFGTTAKKAQQNAQSLYKQAHAIDAVGGAVKDAAEEAKKAIAPFDEFNILAFGDENKGGGGGGAAAIEMPDFDYEYEDMPFDSWGEAFSAFLDKLLDGIPKLEETFKKFADWLNDLAKKLYDMFKFPGVLDKVKQLVSSN